MKQLASHFWEQPWKIDLCETDMCIWRHTPPLSLHGSTHQYLFSLSWLTTQLLWYVSVLQHVLTRFISWCHDLWSMDYFFYFNYRVDSIKKKVNTFCVLVLACLVDLTCWLSVQCYDLPLPDSSRRRQTFFTVVCCRPILLGVGLPWRFIITGFYSVFNGLICWKFRQIQGAITKKR